MASSLVGMHGISTFTSPVNGTSPIDANVVRGNDNTIKTAYDAHDSDATIHFQDSLASARPAAGTVGRKWLDNDTYRVYYDDGSNWHEIAYLSAGGGSFTGPILLTDGSAGAPALAFVNDPDCGLYRIGANNIGFAINGAKVLDLGSPGLRITSGTLTVGPLTTSDSAIYINGSPWSGSNANQFGLASNPTFDSSATTAGHGLSVNAATVAVAFTMPTFYGLKIADITKGAGATVTTQAGVYINSLTSGGTNYAIYTNTGLVRFGDAVSIIGTLGVTGILTGTLGRFTGTVGNQTMQITGVASNYALFTSAPNTASSSFGMNITAGTNSSDFAMLVQNAATSTLFSVRGDGLVNVVNNATVGGTLGVTGLATFSAAVNTTQLQISTAISRIVPGATSLLIRNNADTVTNLSITDGGAVTVPGTFGVTGVATFGTINASTANIALVAAGASGITSTGAVSFSSTLSVTGQTTLNATQFSGAVGSVVFGSQVIGSALTPSATATWDLGSTGLRWENLWLAGNLTMAGGISVSNGVTLAGGSLTFAGGANVVGTVPFTGNVTMAGTLGVSGVITGSLTGNVTGNVSGSSGSTTGNAATATALQTARTINGTSFDGTANITVTAAAGTLTGTTLNATVVTSSLTTVGTLGTLTVSGGITSGAVTTSQVYGNGSACSVAKVGGTSTVTGLTCSGTSTSGEIFFNVTGAGTLSLTVTYPTSYVTTPVPVICAGDPNAAVAQPYTINRLSTAFSITFPNSLVTGLSWRINFSVTG